MIARMLAMLALTLVTGAALAADDDWVARSDAHARVLLDVTAAFTPEQRRLFEAAAEVLTIPRSEFLIRRGEPGGDLFLVRSGRLEVVDLRQTPECQAQLLLPIAVVGCCDNGRRIEAAADVELRFGLFFADADAVVFDEGEAAVLGPASGLG